MMKTLVTGANGFVGSSLVRELLKDGVEVRVLVRESSETSTIDGLDVERAYGDIRDRESVEAALEDCDTLYHTAALYSLWEPDNRVFYDINVGGTKTVLNAALKRGIGKAVLTSSIVAVGSRPGGQPADETTELKESEASYHYARSKLLAEAEALEACRQGLPLVIVNPATVIGVRDAKPTPSGKLMLDAIRRKLPGYIQGGINIVDVEDVARGHILAAQKGRVGERYILGNENLTVKEYLGLIGEVSGVAPPSTRIPYPLALTLAFGYQLVAGLTKKPPVLTTTMVREGSSYAYYDSSKAIKELGMPQTPIRATVEKAIDWYRENGYLN